MADFNLAIGPVLQHEDPGLTGSVETDSNGWPVRYGINQEANSGMPVGFFGDMANAAALAAAKARYEANYWAPLHLGDVQDQGVAGKVLDLAVNMGTGEAPFLFQRAINAAGGNLIVDGKVGPLTIEAANAAQGVLVLTALRSLACQFYRDLVARKPEDAQYLDGWLARARS